MSDDGALNMGASLREWRRVPIGPYRAYEVSSDGYVRRGGRELVGCVDRYGYRTVQLSYAGLPKRFKVHRLVCEAFHGPPNGRDACHLDGNPANNRATNLSWGSRAENVRQSIEHGTFTFRAAPKGEDHHASKFCSDDVAAMRACRGKGWSEREIAKKFGCSPGTAHKILAGERYA